MGTNVRSGDTGGLWHPCCPWWGNRTFTQCVGHYYRVWLKKDIRACCQQKSSLVLMLRALFAEQPLGCTQLWALLRQSTWGELKALSLQGLHSTSMGSSCSNGTLEEERTLFVFNDLKRKAGIRLDSRFCLACLMIKAYNSCHDSVLLLQNAYGPVRIIPFD